MRIAVDAFRHFLADDGWAIASHIALSTLMALFPFLIVVTALAGFFFGSQRARRRGRAPSARSLAEGGGRRRSRRTSPACSSARAATCSLSASLFALYFASSGVESLRVGLNRAYDAIEPRSWWLLRLESIVYVLVGAVAILAFSFLVVLAPLIWAKLVHYVPRLAPFSQLSFRPLHGGGLRAGHRADDPAPLAAGRPARALPTSRPASWRRCCCG